MTRADGIKILQRLFGKAAAWRESPKALDTERRQQVQEQARITKALRDSAEAQMTARRQALLDGDAEYVALRDEVKRLATKHSEQTSQILSRRVTVGRINNVGGLSFFHVEEQGDNWQDVIDKLKAKQHDRASSRERSKHHETTPADSHG